MPTETHASAENVLSRNDLRASGFSDGWYAAEVFSTFAEGGSPVLRVADEGENGVRIACLDAPVTPGRFYRFCAVLRAPGRCFECVAIWVRNDFTDKRPFAEKHFVLGSGWTDCEIPFLTQQSDHIQILIGPTETTLPTMDAKEITLTEGLYQRAKYLWPRNMP
jgi:hypothetical protein